MGGHGLSLTQSLNSHLRTDSPWALTLSAQPTHSECWPSGHGPISQFVSINLTFLA